MTRPKRFRDMSLSEYEIEDMAQMARRACYLRSIDKAPDGLSLSGEWLDAIEARAKRLLPLWRQWGLEEERSQWRSLKDDPPDTINSDHWRSVIARTGLLHPEATRVHRVVRADMVKGLPVEFVEYCEVPS